VADQTVFTITDLGKASKKVSRVLYDDVFLPILMPALRKGYTLKTIYLKATEATVVYAVTKVPLQRTPLKSRTN